MSLIGHLCYVPPNMMLYDHVPDDQVYTGARLPDDFDVDNLIALPIAATYYNHPYKVLLYYVVCATAMGWIEAEYLSVYPRRRI